MNQWFYNKSGQQGGPVDEQEIKRLLGTNEITPQTLVWSEGMPDWKSAGTVAAFDVSPYASPVADAASEIDWSGYTPSGPQARPWVRYWARTSDFLLFCLIAGVGGIAMVPKLAEMNDRLLGILMLAGYNFAEPILLATFGTTPFKALFRIRVRNHDGTKLNYLRGLRRCFSVWIRGQGLGIPLIALFTGITSYKRLSADGVTSWDTDGGYSVTHREIAWWRWLLFIAIFAGFIGMIILGNETA